MPENPPSSPVKQGSSLSEVSSALSASQPKAGGQNNPPGQNKPGGHLVPESFSSFKDSSVIGRPRSNAVGPEAAPKSIAKPEHTASKPLSKLLSVLSRRHPPEKNDREQPRDEQGKPQGRARSNAVGPEANPHLDHKLSKPASLLMSILGKRHPPEPESQEDSLFNTTEHNEPQGRARSNAVGPEADPHLDHKLSKPASFLLSKLAKRHPEETEEELPPGRPRANAFSLSLEEAEKLRSNNRFKNPFKPKPFAALLAKLSFGSKEKQNNSDPASERTVANGKTTGRFIPKIAAFLSSILKSRQPKEPIEQGSNRESDSQPVVIHKPRSRTSFSGMELGFEAVGRSNVHQSLTEDLNLRLSERMQQESENPRQPKEALPGNDPKRSVSLPMGNQLPGQLPGNSQSPMSFSAKVNKGGSFIDFSNTNNRGVSKGFAARPRSFNVFKNLMTNPKGHSF